MMTDFLDAHQRHWDDAERLFNAKRWANADHLYGLTAECGIKRLMLAFGMPFDAGRNAPAKREDRAHANAIWARLESYRAGYGRSTGFSLPTLNPFRDWDISDRYAHQANFDEGRTLAHKNGAAIICNLIKKAQREGLLP